MRLYALAVSHPAHSTRRMLEHKRLEHDVSYLLPGFHPFQLRLAGFRGATVPALKLDGRRVQGSREIARALDALLPDPPLFPVDPEAGRAVEEAERWGEEELQDFVRRIFRWATANHKGYAAGWGRLSASRAPESPARSTCLWRVPSPAARGATDEQAARDLAELPELLDHADGLISSDVIGGEPPNAADFQIAPSVRLLMAFEQLRPALATRPVGKLAMRLLPEIPEPVPAELPANWVRQGPATAP